MHESELSANRELILYPADNLQYAMAANGILPDHDGWRFSKDILTLRKNEFKTEAVVFFGPLGDGNGRFFGHESFNPDRFAEIFNQEEVLKTVARYRGIDEALGGRVSYLLGGIIREFDAIGETTRYPLRFDEYKRALRFAAKLGHLAEAKSVEAVLTAVSHHIISGGAISDDSTFSGWVFDMVDAIINDPTVVIDTRDLGLSQIQRLSRYLGEPVDNDLETQAQRRTDLKLLEGLPTVGAEFHFPRNPSPQMESKFWKRVAVANMSQYQRGGYVQFSRTDRGIIEIRMNPSVYPVTMANWRQLRGLIPEIEDTFFTVTFNRVDLDRNFSSDDKEDRRLVRQLRGLGLLAYAATYASVPRQEVSDEVDFGTVYLGQSVRATDGKYSYVGQYRGEQRGFGQVGIYAGFGYNFDHLAYYPAMAIARPQILDEVSPALEQIQDLDDALETTEFGIRGIFKAIDYQIDRDPHLRTVKEAGNRLIDSLSP